MTQIEREELVERYLAGEMNQTQESDFFLHVAVDDELQRTLKAFRIMDQTIGKDRDLVVPERSRYRENVMALLAATQVVAGGGVGASVGAASGNASGAASAGAASSHAVSSAAGVSATAGASASAGSAATSVGVLGALGAWKAALIAVVGGMVVVGTALVVTPKSTNQDLKTPPAVTAPAPEIDANAPSTVKEGSNDAVTGAAQDAAPTAAPQSVEEKADAPAVRSDVESPRNTRASKMNEVRAKSSAAQESEVKPSHNPNEVIRLSPTSSKKQMEIELNKPNQK